MKELEQEITRLFRNPPSEGYSGENFRIVEAIGGQAWLSYHPFRAYRYDRKRAGDINRLVTQPYDKISPELQQDYYRRSPHNVVRITKSLEKTENPDTDYSAAGATMRSWIRDSVLIQDPEPAIYVYYQDYEVEGEAKLRRGFIALLDLNRSGRGFCRTSAPWRNRRKTGCVSCARLNATRT